MQTRSSQDESQKEMKSSLEAIAKSIAGKDLSAEELRKLEKQMRTDKDAQSAVKSITNDLGGTEKKIIKYCPVDGQRFSARVPMCPEHNVALKIISE